MAAGYSSRTRSQLPSNPATVVLLVILALRPGPFQLPDTTTSSSLPRDSTGRLAVDERTRTYEVHLPPAYDGRSPLPLVLALHGGGGTSRGMARLTHFNDVADRRGFIVVYPNAVQSRWMDGRETPASERGGINDVGFISTLIAKLGTELRVDPHRVYATGISNGGFMSHRLVCERLDAITAVAVVAATLAESLAPRCQPSHALPMLLIHGTHDPLVPWDGGSVSVGTGGRILSVPATITTWVRLNGCESVPTVTRDPDPWGTDTHVRREIYSSCRDGAEVILIAIEGGGHTWPGGIQYLPERIIGKTHHAMDASELIWEFFQRHPKR